MEPLSGESGNQHERTDRGVPARQLQWSRSPERAETLGVASAHRVVIRASMEPLSGESGNTAQRGKAKRPSVASMEPLSGESGNPR